jgi:hypothetical protein
MSLRDHFSNIDPTGMYHENPVLIRFLPSELWLSEHSGLRLIVGPKMICQCQHLSA